MSLCAVLVCTDEGCAEEFEACGPLEAVDTLTCEGCGCALQALAFYETRPALARLVPGTAPPAPLRIAA